MRAPANGEIGTGMTLGSAPQPTSMGDLAASSLRHVVSIDVDQSNDLYNRKQRYAIDFYGKIHGKIAGLRDASLVAAGGLDQLVVARDCLGPPMRAADCTIAEVPAPAHRPGKYASNSKPVRIRGSLNRECGRPSFNRVERC